MRIDLPRFARAPGLDRAVVRSTQAPRRRDRGHHRLARFKSAFSVLLIAALSLADGWAGKPGIAHADDRIQLLRRSITQDQGAWVLDYELSCGNRTGLILTPEELSASAEGWVSNSRVASHTVPRPVHVALTGTLAGSALGNVITGHDESEQCKECLGISVWTGSGHLPPAGELSLISLSPGEKLHVRLRLEHQHVLYGNYDPLLGVQTINLKLGSRVLKDRVPLDREYYLAQPRCAWPKPPSDRCDTHHFVSAPDSLHLEAHVPGHQSYRYSDTPVRYGAKLRLCFWYLIAVGTEGECRVQLDQYKDTPTTWHPLMNSHFEKNLDVVGRWTKVEQVIQADNEATTMALGFQIISENNVGEMWIDDVSLEPLGRNSATSNP